MATIEQRGNSWRVAWRLGGNRDGKRQSLTFEPDEEKGAKRAAKYVEAHGHNITRAELIAHVYGIPAPEKGGDGEAGRAKSVVSTVEEFAERWLTARTRLSPGQKNTYRGQLRRVILPAIGHLHLDEVTGTDVAGILTALQARFADRTVARYYACIHALFAFAEKEKVLDDNPAGRTDFVRDIVTDADDQGDHCYLELWELDLIEANAHPDVRDLIAFIADTGTRISEATAVQVGDVDVPGAAVWIRAAWKYDGPNCDCGKCEGGWRRGKPKGNRSRRVDIGQTLTNRLAARVKGKPKKELLFQAPEGGWWPYANFLHRRWEPAILAASRCSTHPPANRGREVDPADRVGPLCADNGGINNKGKPCRRRVRRGWNRCHDHLGPESGAVSACDCPGVLRRRPTPHDLRHSHVAWQLAAGTVMKAISKRIGHHSTTITERTYAGILPSVAKDSAGALDRMREQAKASAAPTGPEDLGLRQVDRGRSIRRLRLRSRVRLTG